MQQLDESQSVKSLESRDERWISQKDSSAGGAAKDFIENNKPKATEGLEGG